MANTNRYTFSGKEKQTVKDMGFLDFGARMLETEFGRWFVIDPLAEKYYSVSPYVYCMNNPVRYIDPNGMDWYSYRKTYTDDNGEEQTRTQYKYVQGTMTDEEVKDGGYTHLGNTHLDTENNIYYSLGGAVLEYDRDSQYSMKSLLRVMMADRGIITTVNSFEGISDFWSKYNEYISTGSNAANVLVNYMESSSKFGNFVKWTGRITGTIQLVKDGKSFIDGTMTTEGFVDAAANAYSLFGGGLGAGVALEYNLYKSAGKFFIRGVNKGENYLRKKLTNPNTYLWGW